MSIIYRPPRAQEHVCSPPADRWLNAKEPVGTIYRCPCGRHWQARLDDNGTCPNPIRWFPVRWCDFEARRIIRGIPVSAGSCEGP